MKRRFSIGFPPVAAAAKRWRAKRDMSTVWRRWLPMWGLVFMLSHCPLAHGQDDLLGNPSISAGTQTPSIFGSNLNVTENPDPIAKSFRQSKEKLARLKSKLKEALALKDDKKIRDTKEEVKNALNEHFAHDVAIQESQLSRLTKRADDAEALNKKRLAAKDDLIELQLQSFVMEKDTIGSSERDMELQNLFGIGRQSTPDDVPGTRTEPFFADAASELNATSAVPTTAFLDDAPSVQQNRTSTIGIARMKLARASSADEESQAMTELKVALEAYFDRDLEERKRLLKTVRADIEKMKQKLEKRASAKNSIIELQFKMFVNEASGLGFFSPPATTNDFGSRPDPNGLLDPFSR